MAVNIYVTAKKAKYGEMKDMGYEGAGFRVSESQHRND